MTDFRIDPDVTPVAAVLASIRDTWMALAGGMGETVTISRPLLVMIGSSLNEQISRSESLELALLETSVGLRAAEQAAEYYRLRALAAGGKTPSKTV